MHQFLEIGFDVLVSLFTVVPGRLNSLLGRLVLSHHTPLHSKRPLVFCVRLHDVNEDETHLRSKRLKQVLQSSALETHL